MAVGLVFILFYELNPEAWWPVFTALGRAALSSGGVEESRKTPLTQSQRSALTPRDGKGGAVPGALSIWISTVGLSLMVLCSNCSGRTHGNMPPCVLFGEKCPPPVNSDMDKTFLNVVIFCIKNTCVENTVVCVATFDMCLT